ncbi:amino acid ABC transporter permease [Ralstonia mannitolilytica]|uniref:amino acid ABC transporter permease n=1 Tax=Ralstonia mannitolilytica TaxID=105219 RepID=UPI001C95B247|nr:amino acid ABC transporter permease [Ralstonia mannitolilytica]MBY4717534.1 amino acid ABC transporter permease [Ralstonia mannitolilytica]
MNFNFLLQQVATGEHATYLDWILKGVGYTAATAAVSFLFALVIGIALGVARDLPCRAGKLSTWFFELVNSIPLMVMLFLTYQVAPSLLFPEAAKHMDFLSLTILTGVAGLSVFTGMRVSSHVLAAIQAIDASQKQASKVLGFSQAQTYRLIVLPQALKNAVPTLTSEFLSTIKNTSAMTAIGLPELTKQVQNIMDNTSALYEPFIIVMLCYLVMNLIVIGLVSFAEKQLHKGGKQ